MSSIHDSNKKYDVKALRLCRQVLEALQAGLSGECADEILQQVEVRSVDPSAEASRMIVTVSIPASVNPADALARLEGARGLLRSVVASAIHRKKVPDLAFRIAGPEEASP
jgi:ribosome-binding factor A